MKLILTQTNRFKRQIRTALKRGKNEIKILTVIELLKLNKPLPQKYHDHKLSGKFKDCRECHIEPDWLLIYRLGKNRLELLETGTHADLY